MLFSLGFLEPDRPRNWAHEVLMSHFSRPLCRLCHKDVGLDTVQGVCMECCTKAERLKESTQKEYYLVREYWSKNGKVRYLSYELIDELSKSGLKKTTLLRNMFFKLRDDLIESILAEYNSNFEINVYGCTYLFRIEVLNV